MYNDFFKQIVFSNLCIYDLKDYEGNLLDKSICEEFQDGIMRQGLYTSTIKYWDYMKKLHTEFFTSERTRIFVKRFFNDENFNNIKTNQLNFFRGALTILITKLQEDINTLYIFFYVSFDKEYLTNQIIFFIYILYVVLAYMFAWNWLIKDLTKDFLKSKSVLGIIPAERLMEISEIRDFLLANSRAT